MDLASQDGSLRMRSNASCVTSPGFLSAYFDPAVVTGEEPGSAGLAAGEAEEEALALEELGADEGLDGSALQRRAQQEAERVAAAAALASLQKGDSLSIVTAGALEHETRPPPRYTEGGWRGGGVEGWRSCCLLLDGRTWGPATCSRLLSPIYDSTFTQRPCILLQHGAAPCAWPPPLQAAWCGRWRRLA